MGYPANAVPAVVGGGIVPVLGVGAVSSYPGGSAVGGGAGIVNISTDFPGAVPIVTPNSGPTPFTSCAVGANGANVWTVNTARTDTNVATSVILHVLWIAIPALR